MGMITSAVVLKAPQELRIERVALVDPTADDVVVDIDWSGVSTGTERLLWTGRMPQFPGMGYPLVPGYEAVGRVVEAGATSGRKVGDMVFVPGAKCYVDVRGLFGAAAGRMVAPGARTAVVDPTLGDRGALLALAATAFHAFAGHPAPDLIVGHGVVGRLIARIAIATGAPPPVVWELNPVRRSGALGYEVVDPAADGRRDYRVICDASGAEGLLDTLIQRLAPGGEIVLAGFYEAPLSFSFPPAFMREARLRIAAEWKPADLAGTSALIADGKLSLDGLITHRRPAAEAAEAYPIAFDDPACLKMLLDWSSSA